MALTIGLFVGFALGLIANIRGLGLAGFVSCPVCLFLFRSQGTTQAVEMTVFMWLTLQLGFAAALGFFALSTRRVGRQPANKATVSLLSNISG